MSELKQPEISKIQILSQKINQGAKNSDSNRNRSKSPKNNTELVTLIKGIKMKQLLQKKLVETQKEMIKKEQTKSIVTIEEASNPFDASSSDLIGSIISDQSHNFKGSATDLIFTNQKKLIGVVEDVNKPVFNPF